MATPAPKPRSPRRTKRIGRPVGTVSLTKERWRQIVTLIEAGAYDYVAAEAVGVQARTFRDWIARGEGRHPTRKPTPALVAFATEVREAKARVRAAKEIAIATKNPEFWLTHVARSKPGREGWTDPVEDEAGGGGPTAPVFEPSFEEAVGVFEILRAAGAFTSPGEPEPSDPDDEGEDTDG